MSAQDHLEIANGLLERVETATAAARPALLAEAQTHATLVQAFMVQELSDRVAELHDWLRTRP